MTLSASVRVLAIFAPVTPLRMYAIAPASRSSRTTWRLVSRENHHACSNGAEFRCLTERDAALAAYDAKADELADGRWIWTTAGGWNVNQLDTPQIFTFDELSAVAPHNPV